MSAPTTLGWSSSRYRCVDRVLMIPRASQKLAGVQHALLRRVLQAQVLPVGERARPPKPQAAG